jgi:hypothetical protein
MDDRQLAHAALVREGSSPAEAWQIIAMQPDKVKALADTQRVRVEAEIKANVKKRYGLTEAGKREQAAAIREAEQAEAARVADARTLVRAQGIDPTDWDDATVLDAAGMSAGAIARAEADVAANDWNANAAAAGFGPKGDE